ncbi:MAG: CpXC domain-containing protein [Sphaerobacter sp.]|nr:CpXC domain-containing protein [Sphaerobacter sp.]
MLKTEYTAVDLRCPDCRVSWEAPVARVVNVGTDPDARLGILLGKMHRSRCPLCKREQAIEVIFDYYDPDQALVIQVRPAWEIKAGGGEDWYWARYEDLVQKYASVDVRVDVVFGFEEMIEKYLGGQAAVAAAWREWEARTGRARADAEAADDAAAESPTSPAGDGEPGT